MRAVLGLRGTNISTKMAKSTEAEVINVLVEPTPPYDFKGMSDATFARSCYCGIKPKALNAEAYIQHWCVLT